MRFLTETVTACGVEAPLRCYIPDDGGKPRYAGRRPAVIVFPGGGYGFTYSGEAEPIALQFAAEGICAFVLDYACAPVRFPVPQLQAFKTVRLVREHAADFGIDPNNISTLGFSAGGHLCSCTGTLWNKFDKYFAAEGMDDADRRVYRPDRLILCYPVIVFRPSLHEKGSFKNLLGDDYENDELRQFLSTDLQVDAETPPAFLWTTSEDTGVPIRNSLAFAAALSDAGKTVELHVYPHGGHGSCLGTCVTNSIPRSASMASSEWIRKAVEFVYDENLKA